MRRSQQNVYRCATQNAGNLLDPETKHSSTIWNQQKRYLNFQLKIIALPAPVYFTPFNIHNNFIVCIVFLYLKFISVICSLVVIFTLNFSSFHDNPYVIKFILRKCWRQFWILCGSTWHNLTIWHISRASIYYRYTYKKKNNVYK